MGAALLLCTRDLSTDMKSINDVASRTTMLIVSRALVMLLDIILSATHIASVTQKISRTALSSFPNLAFSMLIFGGFVLFNCCVSIAKLGR